MNRTTKHDLRPLVIAGIVPASGGCALARCVACSAVGTSGCISLRLPLVIVGQAMRHNVSRVCAVFVALMKLDLKHSILKIKPEAGAFKTPNYNATRI